MNRKWIAGWVVAAIVVLSNGVRGAQPASGTPAALPGWRAPTGTWSSVGGVRLDPANPAAFVARKGRGVLLNSPGGKTVDLFSSIEHGDAEVHIEFNVPKGSNSGVYLQGRYEVQVFDSYGKTNLTHGDCGGIYERWAGNRGYEGHAPPVNASRRPGKWQRLDIVFRAPRFDATGRKVENARFIVVKLNGKVLHRNVEVTGPTRASHFEDERPLGPLMLQGDHGPVAYRNLHVGPRSFR